MNFAAIFGVDDRINTVEASTEVMKIAAKSSAALILKKISLETDDKFSFDSYPLNQTDFAGFCEDAKFSYEKMIANCSAVLVGENIVATAAHCLDKNLDMGCDDYYIVFDYISETANQTNFSVKKESVYECSEVLYSNFDTTFSTKVDIALIKLNRKVKDRKYSKVATNRVLENTKIFMVGHPLGISQKISIDGHVMGPDTDSSFNHNLDAFSVNSGSPIFDFESGVVVGINVRGPSPNWVATDEGCNDWHYGDEYVLAHQANYIDLIDFDYYFGL